MKEGEKWNLCEILGSLSSFGIELGGCFPETTRFNLLYITTKFERRKKEEEAKGVTGSRNRKYRGRNHQQCWELRWRKVVDSDSSPIQKLLRSHFLPFPPNSIPKISIRRSMFIFWEMLISVVLKVFLNDKFL